MQGRKAERTLGSAALTGRATSFRRRVNSHLCHVSGGGAGGFVQTAEFVFFAAAAGAGAVGFLLLCIFVQIFGFLRGGLGVLFLLLFLQLFPLAFHS